MKQNVIPLRFLNHRLNRRSPIRPPWSVEESRFAELCKGCDACIQSCHARIIRRGDSGFPEISFLRSGCDFCLACVQACTTGAIRKDVNQPWLLQAGFNSTCLAERGIGCRSCGDVCEQRAIQFRQRVGGRAWIEFNASACNGCGECVSLCPAQAIDMRVPRDNIRIDC